VTKQSIRNLILSRQFLAHWQGLGTESPEAARSLAMRLGRIADSGITLWCPAADAPLLASLTRLRTPADLPAWSTSVPELQSDAAATDAALPVQWLAALAGDCDYAAANPGNEEAWAIAGARRFAEGEAAMLVVDSRGLGAQPDGSVRLTVDDALALAAGEEPIEFIDLRSQQHAIRSELEARVHRVLHHGQYIMGAEVGELERQLAEFVETKHCISCASGTEALLMSLMALGIGPGDEVITAPFTFAATVEVIALVGATPVYVDIEPDTCLMNVEQVEGLITSKTKAIMPVSLYGQVPDMAALERLSSRYGIPVIEDAAQSFGARYWGGEGGAVRRSCNLSLIGCTSFFPSKPLGCYGDGGAIFTADDALAAALRSIRVHGQTQRYWHERIGVGGRMDTLQCAIVLAKLPRFQQELDRRRELGELYRSELKRFGVESVAVRADRDCVWAQMTVFAPDRPTLQQRAKSLGIPLAIHYPRGVNRQPAYKDMGHGLPTPLSDAAGERVVSLPMSPDLKPARVRSIVEVLFST
jgi:UDP-2-acetamido-2-deoxy-ribo-hexuluronate aminotransferase